LERGQGSAEGNWHPAVTAAGTLARHTGVDLPSGDPERRRRGGNVAAQVTVVRQQFLHDEFAFPHDHLILLIVDATLFVTGIEHFGEGSRLWAAQRFDQNRAARPILAFFEAKRMITPMSGTATMALMTALHNRAFIGLIGEY
jgi:hypothetical protein